MLRVWNLSLLVSTFSLTILGTFLTRSGVLNSVHAFSESSIGPWLLTFFAIIVIVSIALIGWRGDMLHAPGAIESPLSREGAFLANNLLFSLFAFVVLLGTVFPLRCRSVCCGRRGSVSGHSSWQCCSVRRESGHLQPLPSVVLRRDLRCVISPCRCADTTCSVSSVVPTAE